MVICVFGRRGSGKSRKTRRMVEKREYGLNRKDRVIIYDTLIEYDGSFPGQRVNDPFAFLEALKTGKWKTLLLQFERPEKYFDHVCRAINLQKNIIFVIEEVDFYTKAGSLPDGFNRMIKFGRHRDISIIANCRRPAEMPRMLSSQSNVLISFGMSEPRDVAYIDSFCNPGAGDQIRSLKKYEYLYFQDGESKIFKDP